MSPVKEIVEAPLAKRKMFKGNSKKVFFLMYLSSESLYFDFVEPEKVLLLELCGKLYMGGWISQ